MKLTRKEWWMRFFFCGYVVNHNTKEIHRLKNKHVNCHLDAMKEKEYVSWVTAITLIVVDDYNGCAYCWPEENTD